MTSSILIQEITRGIFMLGAAALGATVGAYFALRLYFRQKEYELLKHRYLEEGIDVVAAEIQHAFGVIAHNYARCMNLFKSFRDLQGDFDLSGLSKGFLELDASKFNQIAHHRVQTLIGSNVVWEVYQLSISDTVSANAKIIGEIPEAIRLKLGTNRIQASHRSLFDTALAELKRLHDENDRFSILLRELQVLAYAVERHRLRFEELHTFRDNEAVRSAVARLEESFRNELAPYREAS